MPGTFQFKNASVTDFLDRPWMDAVDFSAKIPLLQSAFTDWKNAHLLAANPHSLDIVTPEGEHFAMVPTANNDYVNPDGSEYAGMVYLFKIPNKGGRTLDLDYSATIYDTQEQWIYSNTGVAAAGSSGGTPLGLTTEQYDTANFRASNFRYAWYGDQGSLTDSDDVGELGDGISVQLQSVGSTNNLGQMSSEFVTATITLNVQETEAARILKFSQYNNLDKELLIYTRYNEIFDFQNGCVRPERTGISWDDKNGVRRTMLAFKGTIAYPQISIDTAPGGIYLGRAVFTLA